jgi:hypothetical protein
MVWQIELRGGPLDGQSLQLDEAYPEHVLMDLEPELREATEDGPAEVVRWRRALYKKRPKDPRKLAVYYDFAGIH